jgi:hypothetical protein
VNFQSGTRSEVFDCAYPVGTGTRLKDIWQRCDPNGIFGPVQIDQESKSVNGDQRYSQNRQFCAVGP